MIKAVTSVTVFNDAVGMRMSISYSEIDESTGQIISDNKRVDRVITDQNVQAIIDALDEYARAYIGNIE